jgi:hypothetical protein
MEKKRKETLDIRTFFVSKKPTTTKLEKMSEDTICAKCSTKVKTFDQSFHDAFECPPKSKENKPTATLLQDGLVLFRNWLTTEEQQHTIDFCIKLGA